MHVIEARNVGEALPRGLRYLRNKGVERNSRNGPVLVSPVPVTTVYRLPWERVVFWEERDANPFFHFFESLWMLAGRNDVEFVARFAKNMRNYSDTGTTLHGAYGHRWVNAFGSNQLKMIAKTLRANPEDRRCVLQMWAVGLDLGVAGKDVPCNTHAYFTVNELGLLDMTVCCRSNDIIWGAYGANAVHFSFLQEYMAGLIGVRMGTYYQVSNNYHAYLDTFKKVEALATLGNREIAAKDPYTARTPVVPASIGLNLENVYLWHQDLDNLLGGIDTGKHGKDVLGYLNTPFFSQIAFPLAEAHRLYKAGDGLGAMETVQSCTAADWRRACSEWLDRRAPA